jgi:hypothetical protein
MTHGNALIVIALVLCVAVIGFPFVALPYLRSVLLRHIKAVRIAARSVLVLAAALFASIILAAIGGASDNAIGTLLWAFLALVLIGLMLIKLPRALRYYERYRSLPE